MIENRVKRIMREGGMALGTYVGAIGGPHIIEIIGHAGYDAAFIDMEHTSLDLHDIEVMVLAAERMGITAIVRPPGADPDFLLRLLDIGVQGVQIPHITNGEAARAAVRAVRYAPLGERGMGANTRVANYGLIPVKEHVAQSNRELLLAVMIEDKTALDEIDQIASTEGIDLIVVGPSDMSQALGVTGTPDHPKLVETINRVADAIRKHGVARLALPMHHRAFPRTAGELLKLGVGYSNCQPGPEGRLMKSLRTQLEETRKALGR